MTTISSGVAAADDYAGKTYADTSAALSNANMKPVIATVVGSTLPLNKCIVTHSEKAPWLKGDNFAQVTNTVLLNLNCNAAVATAGLPGNSAASPEGRAAKKEQEAEVWKATTPDGAQWCAENQKAHADWGAAAFVGCPGT
jgi:hypothetical protein